MLAKGPVFSGCFFVRCGIIRHEIPRFDDDCELRSFWPEPSGMEYFKITGNIEVCIIRVSEDSVIVHLFS